MPEDQTFTQFTLRDAATHVDDAYKPPRYYLKARQKTSVACAWEADDDDDRAHAFAVGSDDLEKYVAPCDDEPNDARRRTLHLCTVREIDSRCDSGWPVRLRAAED